MPKTPELKIEYWPLKKLLAKRWERNPKLHDIDTLIASIVRYGFRDAVGYDATLKAVVEGHGRIEALERMKAEGFSIPKGILQSDTDWLVPVSLGINAATQADAMAYAKDHNSITMLGSDFTPQDTLRLYDRSLLSGLLLEWRDSDALPVSVDAAVVSELLASLNQNGNGDSNPDPGAQIDRAGELQKKWKTESGQLWQIGKHKLLCGDSTKREDVERLMEGERAVLMNTDPPYGIDMVSLKDGMPVSGMRDLRTRHGDIKNDDLTDGVKLQAFLESAIRAAVPHLVENAAFYLWHPMLTQGTFFAAAAAADILIHRQIIWIKPSLVLTRSGMYHWRHELCFYGWRRGHMPAWYGNKSQTTVWEVARDDDSGLHPTQKPVELFLRPIHNHTRIGEIVYEPFAGSGSQFIAGEQSERRVFGLEIEPSRCAVALERMVGLGLQPERIA